MKLKFLNIFLLAIRFLNKSSATSSKPSSDLSSERKKRCFYNLFFSSNWYKKNNNFPNKNYLALIKLTCHLTLLVFFICITNLTISSQAQAGVRIVGNGGDVIVCKDSSDKIVRIELLDHFEAINYRNQIIDLGPEELNIQDKLEIAFQRLKRLSPDRAKLYHEWADSFFAEAQFREDLDLIDIPDSDHSILPKGCNVQQIVNQATILLPGQKRYTIDNSLWSLLSNTQKAGLILHEVVYREALQLKHTHSVNARILASLMASPSLETITLKEFVELLVVLEFNHLSIQGVQIDLNKQDFDFYDSTHLHSATVIEGSVYRDSRSHQSFPLRDRVEFDEQGNVTAFFLANSHPWQQKNLILILAPQIVKLHNNGLLALAVLEEPSEYIFGEFQLLLNGHLEFYDNANLKRAKIESGLWLKPHLSLRLRQNVSFYKNEMPQFLDLVDPLSFSVQNKTVHGKNWTKFYSSGSLQQTVLAKDTILKTINQNSHLNSKMYLEGQSVYFNEQGLVVE
ncbi:MAG: hypothetical protein H6625_00015 [Bdellovibrionaceae bacterium]|nr:hypothetical protein [Pseudobdellovibrionaceae bacterium]